MIKLLLLIATCFLSFVSSVWAGGVCKEPVKPELPSERADTREMEKAGKDINAYVKEMTVYRECFIKLINDADNNLAMVIEGWNFAVERLKGDKRGAADTGNRDGGDGN